MAKLSKLNSEECYQYGDVFVAESGDGWSRLRIGPNSNHIRLLDRLSEKWPTPRYYVLYVSLVLKCAPKTGEVEG